jgi:hypothetical protein
MKEGREHVALEAIYQRREIQQIIEIEPAVSRILALAADPEPRANRWLAYEALKRMSSDFVGWDARHDALRTTMHHDALMDAIDTLLPQSECSDEEESA